MPEECIDVSNKKPQILTRKLQEEADVAVIVCSGGQCPVIYTRHVEEWNIPNSDKMSLEGARKIRDAIKAKVLDIIKGLQGEAL